MNWDETKKFIEKGYAARLPEWDWHIDLGSKKYHAAGFEAAKYSERTDWELCGMPGEKKNDFGWAITAMNAGKKVRRESWNEKGYIWKMPAIDVPIEWIKEEGLLAVASENGTHAPCLASIRKRTKTGAVLTGWNPDADDVFATDWELA